MCIGITSEDVLKVDGPSVVPQAFKPRCARVRRASPSPACILAERMGTRGPRTLRACLGNVVRLQRLQKCYLRVKPKQDFQITYGSWRSLRIGYLLTASDPGY